MKWGILFFILLSLAVNTRLLAGDIQEMAGVALQQVHTTPLPPKNTDDGYCGGRAQKVIFIHEALVPL
ncbi:hypothetical protein K1X76_01330 [bacterium]|nr:hypothetical protein [bacterium]